MPSGVSALPALQTRHTGGSTGQHIYPGAPTSSQHDTQPALRASSGATRKDDGSEIPKGSMWPAAPTETQNFKRCAPHQEGPRHLLNTGCCSRSRDTADPPLGGWSMNPHRNEDSNQGTPGLDAVAGKAWRRPRAPSSGNASQRALLRGGAGPPRAHSGLRLPQGPQRMGITPRALGSPCRHSLPVPRRDDRDALPRCPGAPPSTPLGLQNSRIRTPRGTRDAPPLAGHSAVDTALAARADVAVCMGLRAHNCRKRQGQASRLNRPRALPPPPFPPLNRKAARDGAHPAREGAGLPKVTQLPPAGPRSQARNPETSAAPEGSGGARQQERGPHRDRATGPQTPRFLRRPHVCTTHRMEPCSTQ